MRHPLQARAGYRLAHAVVEPPAAEADPDLDAVRVLTVHKAKGLEFPCVIMVDLIADRFPSRARRDPIELPAALLKDPGPPGDTHRQEERRLFYVGMTRAQEDLLFTSARDHGTARPRKGSPFVRPHPPGPDPRAPRRHLRQGAARPLRLPPGRHAGERPLRPRGRAPRGGRGH